MFQRPLEGGRAVALLIVSASKPQMIGRPGEWSVAQARRRVRSVHCNSDPGFIWSAFANVTTVTMDGSRVAASSWTM
jgi:hypothetical protein